MASKSGGSDLGSAVITYTMGEGEDRVTSHTEPTQKVGEDTESAEYRDSPEFKERIKELQDLVNSYPLREGNDTWGIQDMQDMIDTIGDEHGLTEVMDRTEREDFLNGDWQNIPAIYMMWDRVRTNGEFVLGDELNWHDLLVYEEGMSTGAADRYMEGARERFVDEVMVPLWGQVK